MQLQRAARYVMYALMLLLCINLSAAAQAKLDINKQLQSLSMPDNVVRLVRQAYSKAPGLIWTSNSLVDSFISNVLRQTSFEGLNPDDYYLSEIVKLINNPYKQPQDIITLDVLLTSSFMLLADHLAYGRIAMSDYNHSWERYRRKFDIVSIFFNILSGKISMDGIFRVFQPTNAQYGMLKAQLTLYKQISEDGGWPHLSGKITQHDTGPLVKLLQQRLLITGELHNLNTDEVGIYSNNTIKAVVKFQRTHGITPTGTVDTNTLGMLNIPADVITEQISLNMDRIRQMPDYTKEGKYILVNIPDYSLSVIENGYTLMSMNVIVGKRDRQSCVLNSKITYLVINPYWDVPVAIAKTEILPHIQSDHSYLADHQIKVYNVDEDGRSLVDVDDIDWNNYSADYFPYLLVQNHGDTNPLGRVKFMFQNRCSTYLHDTPYKKLFNKQVKALSHGCIRLNYPIKLAAYILNSDARVSGANWNESSINHLIDQKISRVIPLQTPHNLHIVYMNVWVSSQGDLQVRNDIYNTLHVED